MIYRITASSRERLNEEVLHRLAYQDGVDEFGHTVWRIEINTLEELMKFIRECGHPIIVEEDEIEIYNWYRE